MCCKKFADSQQSSWKIILLRYLRQFGGKLILGCDFSVKKLPLNLPKFYEECLEIYTEYSAAVEGHIQDMDNNNRSNIVIWNRHILIEGKSVFYHSLFDKGIITLEDLISDTNKVLIKQNPNALTLTPLEWFQLIQIFDALPT